MQPVGQREAVALNTERAAVDVAAFQQAAQFAKTLAMPRQLGGNHGLFGSKRLEPIERGVDTGKGGMRGISVSFDDSAEQIDDFRPVRRDNLVGRQQSEFDRLPEPGLRLHPPCIGGSHHSL
ncbi:hypothetical protein [Rhodopseudomonas faecalis]|uniref:hypothetical protein n=1 Tax=Rhodopseudomonas faecalis TaxID=99655 RepID=UPI000DA1B895|nr:hypothetical protein [Rhodopseudomonas faecalis]